MVSVGYIAELCYLIVIDVLILLGNSLVILAFYTGPRSLRTYTNYFVANLALSDLLVGCIALPFWICVRLGLADYKDPSFQYLMSLDIMFGSTSILCLVAISLERMYAVRYPAQHYNLKCQSVYTIIVGIWLFGIFLTFIKFSFPQTWGRRVYAVLVLTVDFILPLLIIITCYVIIFRTAKHMLVPDNRESNMLLEIQIAKTISVIIGLFVFSWSPFFTLNILFYFCPRTKCSYIYDDYSVFYASKALHYSNSMMNFLVYAVRCSDFRETFKALLVKRCNYNIIRQRLRPSTIQDHPSEVSLNQTVTEHFRQSTDDKHGVLLTPNSDDHMYTVVSGRLTPTSKGDGEEKKLWKVSNEQL